MSCSTVTVMCFFVVFLLASQTPTPTKAQAASSVTGLSPEDELVLLNIHNELRNISNATNMEKLVWTRNLARIAQAHSSQCVYENNANRNYQTAFTNVGENIGFSTAFIVDYAAMVEYWARAGENYDINMSYCHPFCDCDPYLQLVWATTCSVGCGATYCDPLVGYPGGAALFLVCNYGPGFDSSGDDPPYITGAEQCLNCPANKPNCEYGLCVSPDDQMMCIGSDPHFSVRLPSGHNFCYTVQGEHNINFNLYSSSRLRINARFIPDETSDNTWLGVIGIIIMDGENRTTQLMFEATSQLVYIADDVILNAGTIERLVFKDGRLVIANTPRRMTLISPKVHIDIRDSRLNFTIAFRKKQHLDLLWHSTGHDENMHGIIGQFFRRGVKVDEEQEMLVLPERAPVPVKQRPVWAFMKTEVPNNELCWTSIAPSSQGEGIIEGEYLDYKVNDIFSTESKFL